MMANKVKFSLFLVFAVLTFHQFYTFANQFDFSALFPADNSRPTVLHGIFATDPSNSVFDPLILLLALNIALWVERPERIQRAPLILTFITNLSIAILRIGIAAPALKRATTSSNIQTLGNLSARWNAVYAVLATISALVVLALLIQPYMNKDTLNSARILAAKARNQLVKGIALSNKAQLALLIVFAVLAFYQSYTFARRVNVSALVIPIAPEQLKMPPLPTGTGTVVVADVRVTYAIPAFNFGLPFFLLVLNVIFWLKQPDRIGRKLLITAFIANLAIVIIYMIITSPIFNLAPIPAEYRQNLWIIRNFYAKWNLVCLMAAIISSLIAIAMLVQVLRKH